MWEVLVRYYIYDYYDWDKNAGQLGLVSDPELYSLCRSGFSRFYRNLAYVEYEYQWDKNSGVSKEERANNIAFSFNFYHYNYYKNDLLN